MTGSLKILLLEDNHADAEILQYFLHAEKPDCEFKLVSNGPAFIEALKNFNPDVILSDNTLPSYSAAEALEVFKQFNLHIPFILVTGTVSEEFAAGIIKAGADDYILKDRLIRLPAAIDSAIEKKRIEAEKEKAEAIIHFNASLLNTVGQSVIATDINGKVLYWNKAAETLYGWTSDESIGKNIVDLTPSIQTKDDALHIMSLLSEGKSWSGEFLVRKKDGSLFPALVTDSPMYDQQRNVVGVIGVSMDISERKKAAEELVLMQKKIADQKILEQKKISRAIIKAQEQEKIHISQELHDNINQILAGAKMYLKMASKKDEQLSDILAYPIELLDNSIEEIRRLTYRKVAPLHNIKLEEQVFNLLQSMTFTDEIKVHFTCSLQEENVPEDIKLNIYRIIQEQFNNIIKHANAREIDLNITENGDNILLTLIDDGKGFDTNKERKGIGLSNIINRVKSYDGTIQIISQPEEGCTLKVSIPLL